MRFAFTNNSTSSEDITPSDFQWFQLELGETATPYIPYNDSTAVAETLLKIGTYTDQQEIINGTVTRKIGVKVLDGTENWTYTTGTYPYFRLNNANIGLAIDKADIYCTHTVRVPDGIGVANNYQGISLELVSNVDTIKIRLDDICPASEANIPVFKAWLAAQYAAGTPVIIVYPLATATTESVAGQPMSCVEGDNTAEITQASMDGLTLEVTYLAGATVTIQEVENAQLSDDVDVTIY